MANYSHDHPVLKLVTPPTAEEQEKRDAVAVLSHELKRAEAGDIRHVIIITKDVDGFWSHHTTGCSSVREEIGAIESLKWDRLYQSQKRNEDRN